MVDIVLESKMIEVEEEIQVQEPLTLDITDDMYVGSLPEDVIDSFVCMLCYGIVQNPIKCGKC